MGGQTGLRGMGGQTEGGWVDRPVCAHLALIWFALLWGDGRVGGLGGQPGLSPFCFALLCFALLCRARLGGQQKLNKAKRSKAQQS